LLAIEGAGDDERALKAGRSLVFTLAQQAGDALGKRHDSAVARAWDRGACGPGQAGGAGRENRAHNGDERRRSSGRLPCVVHAIGVATRRPELNQAVQKPRYETNVKIAIFFRLVPIVGERIFLERRRRDCDGARRLRPKRDHPLNDALGASIELPNRINHTVIVGFVGPSLGSFPTLLGAHLDKVLRQFTRNVHEGCRTASRRSNSARRARISASSATTGAAASGWVASGMAWAFARTMALGIELLRIGCHHHSDGDNTHISEKCFAQLEN
jgi:hypothetical protein